MLRTLKPPASHLLRSAQTHTSQPLFIQLRLWQRNVTDYASKYSQKLENLAQQRGTTVEELRTRVREQEREQRRRKATEAKAPAAERAPKPQQDGKLASALQIPRPGSSIRKDNSPVKPLSGILNTERLLSKPHTTEQVSALWTAFHASRSGGTGRGFICASVPRETYHSMLSVAQRYPKFVLPIPRKTNVEDVKDEGPKKAYEFYVLQWDFYDAPPPPSAFSDPFTPHPKLDKSANPRVATAIFTPLLEFKLRQTFATPYLVLTFYPELASSHGLVLLRGEITPSAAKESATGDYLLSQQDAQLLAHGLQRFYLGSADDERKKLLQDFHERPGEFRWEDLLKHSDFGV